ncbi:MAG: type II secretion system F family protein, partial [Thermoanaerobaculia bacterium]
MILDFFLVAAVVAALWWLYGAQPTAAVAAVGSGWRDLRSRLGGAVDRRLSDYYSTTVRQAGIDPEGWRPTYWRAKLAGAALPPLLILELLATTERAAIGGGWLLAIALAGSFLPDLWLLLARRRRRQKVEQSLAYFLDLVVAFLHSGLSLTAAFRRAGREGFPDPHPLAREVELVGNELDAGKDPSAALQDLAERTGVPDL